jgi:quercetin dioxygenase-like cupin family protein
MADRPRKSTTTGGSEERRARAMSAPLMRFDLGREAADLHAEKQYADGDRNARTLVKSGPFRLTLVAFRAGAVFDENDQRGSVALHVLEGRVSVRVAEETIEVGPGDVAVVSPEYAWRAVTLEDGLLVLYVAWPPEPGSEPRAL